MLIQMFHVLVHNHHPMDTPVRALVMYPLVTKSVTTAVTTTTWLEIRIELVKEMVPGRDMTHPVSKV